MIHVESAAVLPSLDHLLMEDYENVYEPSEDTYLMCDALNQDRSELHSMGCSTVLEIGSGSGCNITYLAKLLNEKRTVYANVNEEDLSSAPNTAATAAAAGVTTQAQTQRQACTVLATDINHIAISVTQRTAAANGVRIECICTNLIQGLEERLYGNVDVLLFNPPYVPTDDEEVGSDDIAASWAGGDRGRRVIDRFLPLLPLLLSPRPSSSSTSASTDTVTKQGGRCYLVLVEENDPAEITRIVQPMGLETCIVLRKRARNEGLMIMRIQWKE